MATTTQNRTAKKTTSAATRTSKSATLKEKQETAAQTEPAPVQRHVRPELSPNTVVTVKNGYQGRLVYISKKTRERFVWDSFGDEQDIELGELKSARNSSKMFFQNNWFLIDDPEVIDYLGVGQYYDNALSYEEFESLFDKKPEQIKEIIKGLSEGQKQSVAYRARQLAADGEIDSNKVINTLEECLGIKTPRVVAGEETDEPTIEYDVTTERVLIHDEYDAVEPVVNPDYDPDEIYVPREERPEWGIVGMMGQLVVIDDGTCEVNGNCTVGEGGIATASESGWRVLTRLDETHVKVLFYYLK